MSTLAVSDSSAFATKKQTTRRLSLTNDNSKILGLSTERRRMKTAQQTQYSGRNMKTHNSTWTPVVHKPSNQQIFKERCNLISHWFDLWTDIQRKEFLLIILERCARSQYFFVQSWFQERIPLQHLDFTNVLPRFLSLYIFSFLEPRNLCRVAKVSWHWKFLSDQDSLWEPKCVRYGWFLPYTPDMNELGAWKQHYVGCVKTMDFNVISDQKNALYGSRNGGQMMRLNRAKTREKNKLTSGISRYLLDVREPWQGPDFKPQDLEMTHRAFLKELNPNDPKLPLSATISHDRWGIVKKPTLDVTRSLDMATLGLVSSRRKQQHHMKNEDSGLVLKSQRINLSQSLDLENMIERRVRELVEQPHSWVPQMASANRKPGTIQHPSTIQRGVSMGDQAVTYATEPHPRIILLSSRLPAAEMLLDAVTFGVIPIVYEYEGETTTSLLKRLFTVLNGRTARSIGIFSHADVPGHIHLVRDTGVSLNNLDHPEIREFFETITSLIVRKEDGGQLDIFVPLAASEEGMEMLMQLEILTATQFSCPTGIIGNYNHINTEWLHTPTNKNPCHAYFCESKLNVWAAVADQCLEASLVTRKSLEMYFKQTRKDVACQLTGQILYDNIALTNVHKNPAISLAIAGAINELGANQNCMNPLEFLGRYLLKSAGVDQSQTPLTLHDQSKTKLKSDDTFEEIDEEIENINNTFDAEDRDEIGEEIGDEIGEEIEAVEEDIEDGGESDDSEKKDVEKQDTRREDEKINIHEQRQQDTLKPYIKRRLLRLTAQQYSDHPEKRTPIAREILASETEYRSLLDSVKRVYVIPLKAALNSNRAIMSAHNIDIIFTDILTMLDMSKSLNRDLTKRLSEWDPQHSCMGDVFLNICTRLKVYTNFMNNYTIILDAIERCQEQSPTFRSFLQRHERTQKTKMLTLQELLLLPTRRIGEYVTLLTWFKAHTPRNHADHGDLHSTIHTLSDLDLYIKECKQRVERQRQMVALQKTILDCPSLLEANRFLIKHVDVSRLKPPILGSIVPELRVYQQTGVLGLYLFNDALVLTTRSTRHYPFTRAVQYCYKFDVSLGLTRIKITDIPDSKYVQNAFKMTTPKREWFCSVSSSDDKYAWIAVLEKTVRAAVEN